MSMQSQNGLECVSCMFFLFAFVMFIGGVITMIMSEGYMWIPATIFFVIALVFAVLGAKRRSMGGVSTKIIGIAQGHAKVTMDELAKLSGASPEKVSDVLYGAIASGKLRGTIEQSTFIRSEGGVAGVKTVEREVMVTRKVPERCFKCGADINPKEVEWVGPDSVRCPHCGAALAVKTERI